MIFISLFVSKFILTLYAFEVTHQIRPNSIFEASTLGNSCSTNKMSGLASKCNPALFPYTKKQGVSISVVGKSDGDSIDNGRELIFDPITEPLIRKLFEQKNFNSFTFNSELIFKTKLFEISYSPYYLLADLYIFNPAFPEISIHLVNHERLQLTNGMFLPKFNLLKHEFKSSIGFNFYYYEHTYENTVFSLFDLSFQRPEELIHFKTKYGVANDLGFFVENDSIFIPDLSIQLKNMFSKINYQKDIAKSSTRQTSLFLFEPYSLIGLGKEYSSKYGSFHLNFELPFENAFQRFRHDHIMSSLNYNLKLLSLFLSGNKNYQNIGMRFNSNFFNVGLSYSQEKDMGEFNPSKERTVYTGIEISL